VEDNSILYQILRNLFLTLRKDNMSNSLKKIEVCKKLVSIRLSDMPDNHLFHYANGQLKFIEEKIQPNGTMKSSDYDDVFIGLMCARELENVDDEFCNAVYEMTAAIRPPNYEV